MIHLHIQWWPCSGSMCIPTWQLKSNHPADLFEDILWIFTITKILFAHTVTGETFTFIRILFAHIVTRGTITLTFSTTLFTHIVTREITGFSLIFTRILFPHIFTRGTSIIAVTSPRILLHILPLKKLLFLAISAISGHISSLLAMDIVCTPAYASRVLVVSRWGLHTNNPYYVVISSYSSWQ